MQLQNKIAQTRDRENDKQKIDPHGSVEMR